MSLQDLVTAIDAALHGTDDDTLLRIAGHPPEVARRPLRGRHPLDVVLGFTAPAGWSALGARCRADARYLAVDDAPRSEVVITLLVNGDGHGAAVLRDGTRTTDLPGPTEGPLGDALLRALGRPTPAPESSTTELWLRIWLDRLVNVALDAVPTAHDASWEAAVALHPAATWAARCPSGGPVALADATRQLAEAWPWDRLRQEPDVASTPRAPVPREIANWMDDGMYARWILADLPSMEDLAHALACLLPHRVARAIADTVTATGHRWPALSTEI